MSEFCPRCTAPLETSRDADRLCEVCGWWGDQEEVLLAPPQATWSTPCWPPRRPSNCTATCAARNLMAEQIYDAGN